MLDQDPQPGQRDPKLTGDISVLSGLLDRIAKSLTSGTDGALMHGAHRGAAAGFREEHGSITGIRYGWSVAKDAYKTLSHGHTVAHGVTDEVVDETLRSASVNNSPQNSGAIGDLAEAHRPKLRRRRARRLSRTAGLQNPLRRDGFSE